MKKILLALFIIIIFLFGCAKQPVSETQPEEISAPEETEEPAYTPEPTPIGTGKGTISLLVSDEENVASDFDSIKVTFNLVKIYKPKSSEPIEKSINVIADLTELQKYNALKILETELGEGEYSKIKLYASSIKAKLLGNEIEVVIPGDALLAEKKFSIKNKEKTTFVIDLEVVKTGKITTVTGLEKYNINTVPARSGIVPIDVTYIKEMNVAEMMAKINEKEGKKIDRHVFMTQEKGFTPPKITIEKGTKVVWANKDTKKLGITMEGKFDEFVRVSGTYEYTFNRAGVYPYNMKFYTSNQGEVTVTEPEAPKEEETKPGNPRTVAITSAGFSPNELLITKGTQVTFVNKDTKYHNLVIGGETLTYHLAPNEQHVKIYDNYGITTFYDAYNVKDYSGKVTVM